MEISDLLKVLECLSSSQSSKQEEPSALVPGWRVLIRTVTNYWVGEISVVRGGFVCLNGASETKDAGRLSETYKHGLLGQECTEIEHIGDGVLVAIGAIVDVLPYNHPLPTQTK